MGSELAGPARALAARGKLGTLATLSQHLPGFPFGSLAPYALDARGRPLFFLSSMAQHTRNLLADPRCSLFITEPAASGDPQTAERVILVGRTTPAPQEDLEDARERYLAAFPQARQWAGFGDFRFYRLELVSVYYVGGFGVMGWIAPGDYAAASGG